MILERLLSELPGIDLSVVTDRRLRRRVRAGGEGVLDAHYRFMWKWPGWGGRWHAGRVAGAAIDVGLAALAGLRTARWARRDSARWIMSVTDEGFSVIAGAVAAKLARVPHVVMVFDLWEENAYSDVHRALAAHLERRIFRSAAKVICYCDELVEHLRAKHGIESVAIATPVEPGAPAERLAGTAAPDSAEPTGSSDRELLLAGAVYWAQRDAIARLLELRGEVPGLEMVAIGNEQTLRAYGLQADRYEPGLPSSEFARRLRRADALFVGLSLNSDHPEVLRTATPARLVEYMASGVPLLIHAPRGSHVAEYARREDFAQVVDVADSELLLTGLRTVLDDVPLSRARAARARSIADERHGVVVVQRQFTRVLDQLDHEHLSQRRIGRSRFRNTDAMANRGYPDSA